jgi:hypothetical protein
MSSITDQAATYVAVTGGDIKATHTHIVLDDGSEFVVRTGLNQGPGRLGPHLRPQVRPREAAVHLHPLPGLERRPPGGLLHRHLRRPRRVPGLHRRPHPGAPRRRAGAAGRGAGPSYPDDSPARLIAALSIRLRIPFGVLAEEDDEVIATYLDLLDEMDRRST